MDGLSLKDFVVEDNAIRFGLGAIKNVGAGAIESIVTSRESEGPYTNLFEFCERVDSRQANKKVLESLIQSGAMDSLEGHRAQKLQVLETAISFGQTAQSDKMKGQTSIFDAPEENGFSQYPVLPMLPPWKESHQLTLEKETLGFYVSGHPLNKHAREVKSFSSVNLEKGLNSASE